MKAIDQYPQTVVWSAEDDTYVGYCSSFFAGGVCHGDDPVEVLRELRDIVAGELERYRQEGLPLPRAALVSEPVQTVGVLSFA
jgi:predicted RNase H-like HicB family nuclease